MENLQLQKKAHQSVSVTATGMPHATTNCLKEPWEEKEALAHDALDTYNQYVLDARGETTSIGKFMAIRGIH